MSPRTWCAPCRSFGASWWAKASRTRPTAQKSTVIVKVPEVFASLETDVGCYQYKSTVPAGCQHPLNSSTHTVSVETYVGRYPPFYYAIVGLPTLAFVSVKGIYAARLV